MKEKVSVPSQANQTEKWKKILDRLQQKNIVQKYHLAEMLKKENHGKERVVLLAEQYQNQFLQQDEALKLMRDDLATLEELAIKNECDQVYHHKKKLKKELNALRANFKRISSEFAIFVLSAASIYV